jgi:hypothetical protein
MVLKYFQQPSVKGALRYQKINFFAIPIHIGTSFRLIYSIVKAYYGVNRQDGTKMKIEHYSFGRIIIDGKTYTSDVIIYPGRVDSSWWRKEGHNLQVVDLGDVINAKPQVLVIGTGSSGAMRVSRDTISHLESKGIEVHVERTDKAVELFNKLQKDKIVIAALHLTC